MYRYVLAALLFICSVSSSAKDLNDESLYQLLDDIWQYELSVSPLLASREGDTSLAHVLPDNSPKALKAQNEQWRTFQKALSQYKKEDISTDAYIALLMQQYRLANYVDEYTYRAHLVPINSEYGFHSAMASLPNLSTFKRVEDYQAYISRLNALKPYFDQQIAYMKEALKEGYTQPKVVLKGFENSVASYIVENAEDSGFYSPFTRFPEYFTAEQKSALTEQGKAAINSSVLPAYQMFYDFMVDEYIPSAREDIAANNWPDGVA